MDHKDISAFINSPRFVPVLVGIGCVVIAVFIFEAGIAVGFHKAEYAGHWEENYDRNFGSVMHFGVPDGGVPNPHGANGRIVDITLPTFVIDGGSGPERVVETDDDTVVRNGNTALTPDDLSIGEYVVVLGTPTDNGDVDASLIRILPPPPGAPRASSTTGQ
ncbi:MAG TPA: hypothetical protein VHB93_02385 [Candidatus Paceibacterota bacterium]|nr:hypothetical protein [Candidatus Paceibacterota bacterium]